MPHSEPVPASAGRVRNRGQVLRRSARWNIAHPVGEEAVAGSQSLQRALALLNLVGVMSADQPGGVTLAELARSSGRPKPTVHRVLAALTQTGYVERLEPAGTYRLGPQAVVLGALAADTSDPLRNYAHDGVLRLAELSEDTSFLTLRQGTFSLCVIREEGRGMIQNNALGVGDRHPLGIGAGAMAILAAVDDEEIEDLLGRNAPVIEKHYPQIALPVLRSVVARTRSEGYALNEGLLAAGSWAIGVPIRDPQGRPVAAFSIASIEQRLQRERREALAGEMRAEATLVEKALASTRPAGPSLSRTQSPT